jgi:hypothetical protein
MSGYTKEAMTRPLFEEPTEDIGRPDEWSEPLGFLFDPMFDQSKPVLSQQFLDAANLLVESVRRMDCEDYKLTFSRAISLPSFNRARFEGGLGE